MGRDGGLRQQSAEQEVTHATQCRLLVHRCWLLL
jgi:hypothetical protein